MRELAREGTGMLLNDHVTTGWGSPVATQSRTALEPWTKEMLASGLWITGVPGVREKVEVEGTLRGMLKTY